MRLKLFTIAVTMALGAIGVYVLIGNPACLSTKQKKPSQLSHKRYQSPLGFSVQLPINWAVINSDVIKEQLPEFYLPGIAMAQYEKYPERRQELAEKYYKHNMELYYPKKSNLSGREFINSIRVRILRIPNGKNPQWSVRDLQNGKSVFCASALEGYRRDHAGAVNTQYCGVTQINEKYGYLYVISFPDIKRMQSTVALRKSDQEIIYFTLYTYPESHEKFNPLFIEMLGTVNYD